MAKLAILVVIISAFLPYPLDSKYAAPKPYLRNRSIRQAPIGVLNPPIPTSIAHFLGNNQGPIDKCPRAEVLFEDGKCYNLLTQGPCSINQELILDPDNNKPFCAERLCAPDRIFVFSDQLCHDPRNSQLCPPGRELYQTAYGTPICQCPQGTYEGDDDLDDDVCDPLLGQTQSCPPGQVFWFRDFSLPPECLPDPCGGENLNRGPNDQPFVPFSDGRCFQLGTMPNVCPAQTWYSIALEKLQGVCTPLDDAGYEIYNQEDLNRLIEIYGPPITRDTTSPIPVPVGSTGANPQSTIGGGTPAANSGVIRPSSGVQSFTQGNQVSSVQGISNQGTGTGGQGHFVQGTDKGSQGTTSPSGFGQGHGIGDVTQGTFNQGSSNLGQGSFGQGTGSAGPGSFGQGNFGSGQGSIGQGSSNFGQGSFVQGTGVPSQGNFGQGSGVHSQGSFGQGSGGISQGNIHQANQGVNQGGHGNFGSSFMPITFPDSGPNSGFSQRPSNPFTGNNAGGVSLTINQAFPSTDGYNDQSLEVFENDGYIPNFRTGGQTVNEAELLADIDVPGDNDPDDVPLLQAPPGHELHGFFNSVRTLVSSGPHNRSRRSPLPHATPGNVFETRLVGCRAGARRDINAKCRDTVLPSRTIASRPARAAPPVPPRPGCPSGQAFNVRRQCVPTGNAVSSINRFGLG